MNITVRAPGKAVLMGEYAVLDGAIGLVAAVNRGVQVDARPANFVFCTTPGGDKRFVQPALTLPGRYAFRSWNPAATESKAGLGSSAAATVAAVLARRALHTEDSSRSVVFDEAYHIHHSVQGGGSGIDIAASTYGGVIRYQNRHSTPTSPCAPILIWSGSSAATGPRVTQYLALPDAVRGQFVQDSDSLITLYEQQPVEAFQRAGQLIEQVAAQAKIAYLTPGLEKIIHLAEHFGGAAKASGAGGGDCAVAVFDDPEASAAFTHSCRAAGLSPVDVELAGPASVSFMG